MKKNVTAFATAFMLSGCAATGPMTNDILRDANGQVVDREQRMNYGVIKMDAGLAAQATRLKRAAEKKGFIPNTAAPPISIGVGDQIQITIVSANDTGFLDTANGALAPISSTTLPAQKVGPDGMISVPPIGRIRAQGNSVQDFEQNLTLRLGEVLVNPTAIVQMVDRQSAQVTLVGATSGGNYSIDENTRRLVDVIAQAGGASGAAENMNVIMTRGGRTGSATLDKIYENPSLNINLRAGDLVRFEPYVSEFTVLGAGGTTANLQFNDPETNMINALGQSEGARRLLADAKGVFIYRVISREAARQLGLDTTEFVTESVPVIFQFDMKKPEAGFVAQEFEIADGDILYISVSQTAEVTTALSTITSIILFPSAVSNSTNVFNR